MVALGFKKRSLMTATKSAPITILLLSSWIPLDLAMADKIYMSPYDGQVIKDEERELPRSLAQYTRSSSVSKKGSIAVRKR